MDQVYSKLDHNLVLKILKDVIGHRTVGGLHEPSFGGNEWKYVRQCLDERWVSSVGRFVEQFEKALCDYTGSKYAVAVVNGTAALHTALKLVGVSHGDEVLVPALSFVAVSNAVSYLDAVPHFIDSEERTLGIHCEKLEAWLQEHATLRNDECYNALTGRRIRAVVAVHTFGHPVDLDPLLDLCRLFHLELIEDAAEALGTLYKGKHVGRWSKLAALSFNGNKVVTTGGGGAILTDDEELARLAKHLTTTARLNHRWMFAHDRVGFNYRMPNINAALGCAQMESLPALLQKKRKLAEKYDAALAGVTGLKFFREPEFAESNYWLNCVLLDDEYANERDRLLELTNEQGIPTRPCWELMSTLPMFSASPKMDLSISERLVRRLINLPSSPSLHE